MDVNSRDPLQNIIPFRIKGVEIGRFDSSGNLKIGTTTTLAPTVRLDISGGAARVNSGAAASTALTTTGRIGVNTATPTVELDVSGAVNITASSVVATALTTKGRIGINTAAPASDLDVNGAVVMRSTLLLNNSLTLPTGFWHKSNDNVERLQYITSGNTVFKSGSGFLWYDSNNAVRMFLSNSGLLGIGPTTAPGANLDVTGVSRMTASSATATALTTTGRIGVNTATPTVDLDVTGVSRMTASSATATALTTTGRIGVNTASPTVSLDVTGAAKVSTILSAQTGLILGDNTKTEMDSVGDASTGILLNLINTTGDAKPRLRFVGNANNFDIGCSDYESFIWSKGNKNLGIATNATRRMTITNTGNVGIGIEAPTSLLHVAGAAKITGDLDMTSTGKIVNLVTPTAAQDAATKGYVDGAIPIGGIIMWSGTIASIPSNWRLCNGAAGSGTPDLRQRFIVGASHDIDGVAYCNVERNAAEQYLNTVTGGTRDAVVVAHSHTHSWSAGVPPNISGTGNRGWNSGGGHTNGTSLTIDNAGESGLNKNLPPYYALAFIMRVS
jgi:hypothetical protein